jgi:outer membrane protein TolC
MKKLRNILLILVLAVTTTQAQVLTLADALKTALSQNYDVQVSGNNVKTADILNNPGNAGMLPSVNLNGGANFSNNNIRQEFSNGIVVNRNNVAAQNYNASAGVTMVLFDGLRMFFAKKRLGMEEAAAGISNERQILTTVLSVLNAYYRTATFQQQVIWLEEMNVLASQRSEIAKKRFESGRTGEFEYLQAQSDELSVRTARLRMMNAHRSSGIDLCNLINKDFTENVKVELSDKIDTTIRRETLLGQIEQKNPDIQLAKKMTEISGMMLKEARSGMYPVLNASAAYGFNRSQNKAGFALLNQNLGLNYGVGISVPVLNGLNVRTAVRTGKISKLNAELRYRQALQNAKAQLESNYSGYVYSLEIFKAEKLNRDISARNLRILNERYLNGITDQTTVSLAQQVFLMASQRYADAYLALKQSEIALWSLVGVYRSESN